MSDIDPAVVTGLPVDFKALMQQQLETLQKRLSPSSGDKIRIGQNKTFTFPDGVSTRDPFECVIIDFVTAHDYYDSGYDKENISPPDCFARGVDPSNMKPSDNSPNKQAEDCASCPNNQFGTGLGKGKACKNTRLLAVLPPDATEASPIWVLTAAPTAVKWFDKYIQGLAAKHSVMSWGAITTVGFDPASDFPSLRFAQPRLLTEDRALFFYSRMGEAHTRLMQEPDVSKFAARSAPRTIRRR